MSRAVHSPSTPELAGLLRVWALPCVAGALVAALALTALRVDLLRARYGLAEAVREEQTLRAEERELTVELRRLRDPARLAELAREQGFVRPERVIDLAARPVSEPAASGDGALPTAVASVGLRDADVSTPPLSPHVSSAGAGRP